MAVVVYVIIALILAWPLIARFVPFARTVSETVDHAENPPTHQEKS